MKDSNDSAATVIGIIFIFGIICGILLGIMKISETIDRHKRDKKHFAYAMGCIERNADTKLINPKIYYSKEQKERNRYAKVESFYIKVDGLDDMPVETLYKIVDSTVQLGGHCEGFMDSKSKNVYGTFPNSYDYGCYKLYKNDVAIYEEPHKDTPTNVNRRICASTDCSSTACYDSEYCYFHKSYPKYIKEEPKKYYVPKSKKKNSYNNKPDPDDYEDYDDFMDDWDGYMPDGSDAEDYWEDW